MALGGISNGSGGGDRENGQVRDDRGSREHKAC